MSFRDLPAKAHRGPYKLTDAVADAYCRLILDHVPAAQRARGLGLSPQTVAGWLERGETGETPYAEFLERVRQAEAMAVRALTIRIRKAGKLPSNWKANEFLLKLHGVNPESRNVRVNVDVPGDPSQRDPGLYGHDFVENVTQADPAALTSEDPEITAVKSKILRLVSAYDAAVRDSSHIAIVRLGEQLDEARSELRNLVKQQKAGQSLREIPEDQMREKIRQAAENMPEMHLQIAAEVWLKRNRMIAVRPTESDDESAS